MLKLLIPARRHPAIVIALLAIAAAILVRAASAGSVGQAVVYLTAIGLGVSSIELTLMKWPPDARPVSVRAAGLELTCAALLFFAGLAWLVGRFVVHYQPPQGLIRLAWLVLLAGGVFNAFLAIFLLARRYRLGDLGLRLSGLAAAPPVIAIFAASALLCAGHTVTWTAVLEESGGSWLGVLATALLAAVPEEFFRFVWQTRTGVLFRNRAAGWLLASLVWAALHGPKDWDESHSVTATLMGIVNIVPLGLLWGYLTHRTRSMLPSVLLHATNVWGLQNLP